MTYSSSLAAGRQRFAVRGQNAVPYQAKKGRLGPVSNTIILIVLTCLLGLLYLTQVTKTNSYGYRLNELHQEQTKLNEEHDQLEVAAARLQALERVKTSAAAKSLVSVAPSGVVSN